MTRREQAAFAAGIQAARQAAMTAAVSLRSATTPKRFASRPQRQPFTASPPVSRSRS